MEEDLLGAEGIAQWYIMHKAPSVIPSTAKGGTLRRRGMSVDREDALTLKMKAKVWVAFLRTVGRPRQ